MRYVKEVRRSELGAKRQPFLEKLQITNSSSESEEECDARRRVSGGKWGLPFSEMRCNIVKNTYFNPSLHLSPRREEGGGGEREEL